MRKFFSLVAVAVMLGMFFNSCTSGYAQSPSTGTVNKSLIGVWEQEKGTRYVFFADGTYSFGSLTSSGGEGGRYAVYENVLMAAGNGTGNNAYLYTFKVTGGNLELTSYVGGKTETYKKVK